MRKYNHDIKFKVVSFGNTKNYLLNHKTEKALERAWKTIYNYYKSKPKKPLCIELFKKIHYARTKNGKRKRKRKSIKSQSSVILFKLGAIVPEGRTKPVIRFVSQRTKFNPIKVRQIIIINEHKRLFE